MRIRLPVRLASVGSPPEIQKSCILVALEELMHAGIFLQFVRCLLWDC